MNDDAREETSYYNLEGGPRHLIVKGEEVKAVAPGLRLVEATEQEKRAVRAKTPKKEPKKEYGLPV